GSVSELSASSAGVLDERHTTPGVMMRKLQLAPLLAGLVLAGCGADSRPFMDGWTGSMDTLPSGHVVVRNDDRPLWREGTGWRVVEELRIGSVEGGGPEAFGEVEASGVDGAGRIWVLGSIGAQVGGFRAARAHRRSSGQ